MKIAIFLLVGLLFIILLLNSKFPKKTLLQVGIIISFIIILYSLVLYVQPKEYIKYTKTTISKENNSSNTK